MDDPPYTAVCLSNTSQAANISSRTLSSRSLNLLVSKGETEEYHSLSISGRVPISA
jgi:hypothetical protein